MNEQEEAKLELLSSDQPIVIDESEEQRSTLIVEIDATTSLSNVLNQSSAPTFTEFTQQALIDVNSQPLIPVATQNLINEHPSIIMATHQPAKDGIDHNDELNNNTNQVLATAITDADNTETYETTNIMQTDASSLLITEFYEKFPAGKMYASLEELRTTAFEYGKRHNVALTTSKSDKTKVYLICKHGGYYRKNVNKKRPTPATTAENKSVKTRIRKSQKSGCSCLIYARCCRGSVWVIRKSIGEHNHPIADDRTAYAMYRSLEPKHLLTVHRLLKEHASISCIVKTLKASGVNNIIPKDIENIQQDLKRKETQSLKAAAAAAPEATSTVVATESPEAPTVIVPAPAISVPDLNTHQAPAIALPPAEITPMQE